MPKLILRLCRRFFKRVSKKKGKRGDVELSLNHIDEPKNFFGHQYDEDSANISLIKNMRERIERLEEEFKKLYLSRSVYSYKYNRFK